MSDAESSGPRPPGDLARLIEVLSRQAEASSRTADLIESRALPLLERIAEALERAPSPGFRTAPAESRPAGFEEARRAIERRQWDRAESLVGDLRIDHPGAPWASDLTEELDRARGSAVNDLLGRIEAARGANDPDGAMAGRDELAAILRGEPLKEVDRSLAKWLMGLVQRRLRTGTVRPDVVELAGRVADLFGATAEGASLQAALPTLRRSAGLCPRCAEPYAGLGDACPKCLAAAATPPSAAPEGTAADPPEPDIEAELEAEGGPVDLNNERFWQSP